MHGPMNVKFAEDALAQGGAGEREAGISCGSDV
jgi:hypothetical protein